MQLSQVSGVTVSDSDVTQTDSTAAGVWSVFSLQDTADLNTLKLTLFHTSSFH